jgi:predicted acetyltransferase
VSPARTVRPPVIRYRPARRTDVENLAELGARAYRVHSVEKRRDFYTDHPRFGLRDVRVGELDGQIVASLVLYPLRAWVRGQLVPVTGIGSVAVSPEHRRRGIAESLLRSTLRELRQRGDAFVGLYPWRGSYYRRFGWGTIEYTHVLAFAPTVLPYSDEARRVRRLLLPDRPAVEALYEKVGAQGHFAMARSPEWWSRRLWTYPGEWLVVEGRRRGQIEGYLQYEVDDTNGPFKLALSVHEIVAATPEAHRGLVGHLASLADQVNEIHFAAPADHAWHAVLRTAQNLHPGAEISVLSDTGNVAAGLMLRLTDVKAGLEKLPVAPTARGEVVIEVRDDILPANARGWRVTARDGRLTAGPEPAGPRSRRRPRVTLTADVLGPVIAGTLLPTRAAEVGLLESSGGGAEVIERWFRTRPAFLHFFNMF